MISIEKLKELNKKFGDDPKFQLILRNYLKSLLNNEKEKIEQT